MSNYTDTETPSASQLAQVQQRLLNLMTQLDSMQSQLQDLAADAKQSGDQVTALTRNLVDPNAAQATRDQLAELATQMNTQREQLEILSRAVNQVASSEQMAELAQKAAHQEHLDNLAHTVAKQEQMERLIQMVASEERLTELLDTVKNLSRTQYKANALSESKDARIAESLSALQEIVTRRAAAQTTQADVDQEERAELRRNARAELTADFLPAIDGIERAIESGRNMLEQMIQRREERRAVRRRRMAARQQAVQSSQQPARDNRGWFRRMFGAPESPAVSEPNIPPPMPPEDANERLDTANIEAVESWLEGLQLVRDRFLRLLAEEDVHPIPALEQRFDPRLHTAVESELREDAPPETIVRVVRTGYQQDGRVLRYAEVVVARAAAATATDADATPTAPFPATSPARSTETMPETTSETSPEEPAEPEPLPTTIGPMAEPLTSAHSDADTGNTPRIHTETIRGETETVDDTSSANREESTAGTHGPDEPTTETALDGPTAADAQRDRNGGDDESTNGAATNDEAADDQSVNDPSRDNATR